MLALAPHVGSADERSVAAAVDRGDYTAAAHLLRAQLTAAPGDETARFTLARVLGWAGRHAEALAEYDTLVAASPHNVDYALGRARALAWAGRDRDALAELARARSLAPDYEEVWRLELSLLERGHDALRARNFRESAARAFPHATWWREPEREPERDTGAKAATSITAGTVRESLSSGAPDWSSVFVQMDHRRSSASTVRGMVSRDERFGSSDVVLTGGADWRISQRWSAAVELAAGPQAEFMPRAAAAVAATRALARGWEAEARLRYRDYGGTRVTSSAWSFARYFGKFRASYTLGASLLDGADSSLAHSATAHYYLSDRGQLNVGAAIGEEAESIAPGRVLRTDIKSLTVGGRHWLGDRWTLAWWAGAHRQGDLYRRRYVGLSLTAGL